MRTSLLFSLFILFSGISICQTSKVSSKGISIIPVEKERKVDIYFDGKIFTSYIYPSSIEKPVLYPIKTSTDIIVTRGFPIEPRPGERVDHPHHIGWWFNYGDVNGLDFWNNSYAIPEAEKPRYGSIEQVKVLSAESGSSEGKLKVECKWVNNKKEALLTEITTFIFSGDNLTRRIIKTTQLTAVNGDVTFGDNKEGMCAIRVAREFEAPTNKPEVFTDASGKPTTVAALNNEGVNGTYKSSNGKEKDAVWGTRAEWVSLSAVKNNESISICILDHPKNPGFPGYWHARGYGLFSINNIGAKVYNPSETENKIVLKKGDSVLFKHMLLIRTGGFIKEDELKKESVLFEKY